MSAADDDVVKELDQMKKHLKEMEEEAAALCEMQAKVEKEMGVVQGKNEIGEESRRWSSYQHVGRAGSIIPTASLAGTEVRELKKQVPDVAPVAAEHNGDVGGSGGDDEGSETSWCFPSDADDVTMSSCGEGGKMVKVTVCCED
ncbi:uncharacterized protein LOC131158611 [Malania oleifera]|uniref:uncharacterized protein LOC131158611 n=1 Tax=Malania oleifera TaxID=397392 RepID=UPI0025AE69B7|nr:uncharacterized protein LOC131158611 [Malania oleifera]